MTAAIPTPIICPVIIGYTSDLTTLCLLLEQAKSGTRQVTLLSREVEPFARAFPGSLWAARDYA